jgi:DNA-directed RNA polymerase delta subunit
MEPLSYTDSAEKILEKAGKPLEYSDIAQAAIKEAVVRGEHSRRRFC